MVDVLVFGASGYTGIELIRLLAAHPDVKITAGSSRQWEGKRASEMFPFVSAGKDFPLHSLEELSHECPGEIAFLALPHGESAPAARKLLDAGLKVIDLSADLRLNDSEVYGAWYGPHKDPSLLPHAVYGLPEINRTAVTGARLVANPGCYPTTVLLGLAPLVGCEAVDISRPIVDAKSGISGAGRGTKLITSFCESGESFKPYGVLRHRHIPEMEQELSKLAGREIVVRFTPHLIPVSRGMVSTIYLPLTQSVTGDELRERFIAAYRDEPFLRVLPAGVFPDTALVKGSNQCHVAVEVDDRTNTVIVMTCLDNLVKGASGAAVQNMNLVAGFEETAGLSGYPMFP